MLSIIIPTYNERENVLQLIPNIFRVLSANQIEGEVVLVDDASADGTGEAAEQLKGTYPMQVVHRSGKQGLGSAFLAGLYVARFPIVCLMDGDFSHPPELLPQLFQPIQQGKAELTIASRSIPGGKTLGWPWYRHLASWLAQSVARPLVAVHDTTSGYLMFRKSIVENIALFPGGFKIGLEIMARGNYTHLQEIPYVFQDRTVGKSKFGVREILLYLRQLAGLYRFKFLTKTLRESS